MTESEDLTVIIIQVDRREKKDFMECIERIYFQLHGFRLLDDSDEITQRVNDKKQRLLLMFEKIVRKTYYLRIGIENEIMFIPVEKVTLLLSDNTMILTAEEFLKVKFLEEN